MQFRWIPAHVCVPGNEWQTELPKRASDSHAETITSIIPVDCLAATKLTVRQTMRGGWEKVWDNAKYPS